MRLFVAVRLLESLCTEAFDAVAQLRRAAPAVRWVQPESLHITLKFLGEVPEPDALAVRQGLRAAAHGSAAFPLKLAGVGAFPSLRKPRVYWLGADGGASLLHLQSSVEDQIVPLGFPREARPFHPHLTLGRVGRDVPRMQVAQAERIAGSIVYERTMVVQSVELMQSRLSPAGSRYEVLERVPLGTGAETTE